MTKVKMTNASMALGQRIRYSMGRFKSLPNHYGCDFRQIYAFLQESRQWSYDKIQAYKLERLQSLVKHAEQNVPYYQEAFREHGINSGDIRTFEDFSRIPILTREVLCRNTEKFKAYNFESYKPIRTETSGTTGRTTLLYRSRYHEAFRRAVIWRINNEFGYRFRDRRATITVPRDFGDKARMTELDRVENNLIINTYHILANHADKILPILIKFDPLMIWSHPNILCALTDYAIRNGQALISNALIGTYGEKIYPHTRGFLQKAFPGKFFEYYGNRENTIAAWGFSNDNFYEVSEYCHLEIERHISESEDPNTGTLITTSLHNYAFPLIRYDSEDLVKWHGRINPDIPYPVIELIGGRGKDLLLTREGLIIPYLLYYLEKQHFNDKLEKAQIEQISLDEILLRIVPASGYRRDQDEPLLLKHAEESLAHRFKVKLEYRDDIPCTQAGKFPAVLSKLAIDYLKKSE